jgi:glycosyltransferase involved in cell wall biosynthesis
MWLTELSGWPGLTGRVATRARARWHGVVREWRPFTQLVAAAASTVSLSPMMSLPARRRALFIAARMAQGRRVRELVRRGVTALRASDPATGAELRRGRLGWDRYLADLGGAAGERTLSTSLVLKAPGAGGEKGVLYCSFEYNWLRLLKLDAVRELLREYVVVGQSSWSPTDFALLNSFAGLSDDPLFVGVSHPSDVEAYRAWAPTVEPLPQMACDWCDPAMFDPRPKAGRDIDVLMVSHWGRFKRHWLLFTALARLSPRLRVVLVGRHAEGRTEHDLRREARAFGVRQALEFYTDIPISQVAELQARAKVTVALSAREGSCVSITESLFANTPVAVMRGAHIGAATYVNEQTGAVLDPSAPHRELGRLLERHAEIHPRPWAEARIPAAISSTRLNDRLRAHALRRGAPWTADIAPLCWRYVPAYLRPCDTPRFDDPAAQLEQRFGVGLLRYDEVRSER